MKKLLSIMLSCFVFIALVCLGSSDVSAQKSSPKFDRWWSKPTPRITKTPSPRPAAKDTLKRKTRKSGTGLTKTKLPLDKAILDRAILDKGTWNGTVLWNGAEFQNDGQSCTAGTKNTQFNRMASYIDDVDDHTGYISGDKNTITFGAYTWYKHGTTKNYEFHYRMFYTGVAANEKYLKFYQGETTINCDKDKDKNSTQVERRDGICKFNEITEGAASVKINLINDVDISSSHVGNKKAFIVLKGFDADYKHGIHKHSGLYVNVDLESSSPDSNHDIKLNITTKVSDGSPDTYTGTVYWTVGVYDPDYVTVKTISDSSGYSSGGDSRWWGTFEDSLNYSGNNLDCSANGCRGKSILEAVGLSEWGYNNTDKMEAHKAYAFGRLNNMATNSATVKFEGTVLRNKCPTVSKTSFKPNHMKARVIVCKDNTVCRATYGRSEKIEVMTLSEAGKERYNNWDVVVDLKDPELTAEIHDIPDLSRDEFDTGNGDLDAVIVVIDPDLTVDENQKKTGTAFLTGWDFSISQKAKINTLKATVEIDDLAETNSTTTDVTVNFELRHKVDLKDAGNNSYKLRFSEVEAKREAIGFHHGQIGLTSHPGGFTQNVQSEVIDLTAEGIDNYNTYTVLLRGFRIIARSGNYHNLGKIVMGIDLDGAKFRETTADSITVEANVQWNEARTFTSDFILYYTVIGYNSDLVELSIPRYVLGGGYASYDGDTSPLTNTVRFSDDMPDNGKYIVGFQRLYLICDTTLTKKVKSMEFRLSKGDIVDHEADVDLIFGGSCGSNSKIVVNGQVIGLGFKPDANARIRKGIVTGSKTNDREATHSKQY